VQGAPADRLAPGRRPEPRIVHDATASATPRAATLVERLRSSCIMGSTAMIPVAVAVWA
jgi:hypothetical protein